MIVRLIRKLSSSVIFQYFVVSLLVFTIAHSGFNFSYQQAFIFAIAIDLYLLFLIWRITRQSPLHESHKTTAGDAIHLDFKCVHDRTIIPPSGMSEADREAAIRQAKNICCWDCDPVTWRVDEQEGTYSELHSAVQKVRNKIPSSYRGEY